MRRAVVSRSVDTSRRRVSERRTLARLRLERPVLDGIAVTGLAPSVEAALLALPPRVRACVVLRHLEDLSVRQTAELLHLSEGSVKRYVSDGVAALSCGLGTDAPAETVAVDTSVRTQEVHDG